MRFFSGTGDPIAFGVRTRCTGAALLMDATAMPTTQSFERWRDGELLDSANSPTQAVYLAPHRCRQGDKIAMGSSLAGRLSVAIRSVRGRRGAYWSERLVMSALFFHAAIGRFAASGVLTTRGIDMTVRKGWPVARIYRPDCRGQQRLPLPSARPIPWKLFEWNRTPRALLLRCGLAEARGR